MLCKGDVGTALKLIDAGSSVEAVMRGCGVHTLLESAVIGGSVRAINILLEKRGAMSDLNAVHGETGMTVLMLAIRYRHLAAA